MTGVIPSPFDDWRARLGAAEATYGPKFDDWRARLGAAEATYGPKSDSSEKRVHKRQKKVHDDPPSVLFITTHGSYYGVQEEVEVEHGYSGKTLQEFKSPMNIKKINAVTMGVCNFTLEDGISGLATYIKQKIHSGFIENMEDGSVSIKQVIGTHIKALRSAWESPSLIKDIDYKEYIRKSNKENRISSYINGQKIPEKYYSVTPKERDISQPYWRTMTLLTDSTNNAYDLMPDIYYGDPVNRRFKPFKDKTTQEVTLSEILEFIKVEKKINNLIIIDMSCSNTDLGGRVERRIEREIHKKGQREIHKEGQKRYKQKKKNKKTYKGRKKLKKSKSKGSKKKKKRS
jgi:hypothetical protein